MFPISMAAQRSHLADALAKIVSRVDSVDDLTTFLEGPGRDHRKFGVVAEHYDAVRASLPATLEHSSGSAWTPELAADWKAAYRLIGSVMSVAASADEQRRPPWWRGKVVAHEPRSFDVSVPSVQPEPHVGVPSRDLGVQVLARLRPWLAPLLAVTANSPIADGHDTGWASWRYPIQTRWPTAVPPAGWPDAAAYDTAVRGLIGQGAALDERNVYFLARLSPRYPTVEVRVADVCLDAGTAVLLAGLIRALVATALAEARRGTPPAAAPAGQVAGALAAAARRGLAGAGADPFTGQAVDAPALRSRLLDHVYPALSDHGDTETVTRLLRRLDDRGTGADRQRALFTSAASTPAFITALARAWQLPAALRTSRFQTRIILASENRGRDVEPWPAGRVRRGRPASETVSAP